MDRNQIPQPFASLAPEAVALPALEGGDDLRSRRCVRCREVFDDIPSPDLRGSRTDWSLCGSCEAIAFPRRSRSSALLTIVPPHVSDQNLANQDGSHPS